MVITLDFDFIGILIFLWVIFSGISSSKKAKEKRAKRIDSQTTKRVEPDVYKKVMEETKKKNPLDVFIEKLDEVEKSLKGENSQNDTTGERQKPKPVVAEKKKPQVKQEKERKPQHKSLKVSPKIDEIQKGEREWKDCEGSFAINHKAVVNGIIWSEILNPPKSRRNAGRR